MGYLHIPNLYKAQEILAFRQCFALEKIHGTSAHVRWHEGRVTFFSGGESHERFVTIFDSEGLAARFMEQFGPAKTVVVYGEAYGGKCQHMSQTYGVDLKFVAFDVLVDDCWLNVPSAEIVVKALGLEFVEYVLVDTDVVKLDAERDKPSTQAKRNGIDADKIREGVVLRPPFEVTMNNGERVIAKHKREEFSERGRPKVELDPSRRECLAAAEMIALEWVTAMRLEHVIDQILASRDDKTIQMQDAPEVMRRMVEDVQREAKGEIVESQPARKAIAARSVKLLKERLQASLVR